MCEWKVKKLHDAGYEIFQRTQYLPSRIERVLDEFLHNHKRSLDNFSSCNTIYNILCQCFDWQWV